VGIRAFGTLQWEELLHHCVSVDCDAGSTRAVPNNAYPNRSKSSKFYHMRVSYSSYQAQKLPYLNQNRKDTVFDIPIEVFLTGLLPNHCSYHKTSTLTRPSKQPKTPHITLQHQTRHLLPRPNARPPHSRRVSHANR
jgi:hypothetical protein